MRLEFNSRFIREDIGMPTFLKLYGDRFFAETTKLHPNMPLYDNNGHYTRNPRADVQIHRMILTLHKVA